MRNRIFGIIGVVWGALIVVNGMLVGPVEGSESYETGRIFALVFGGALFFVGAIYFFKKPKNTP